jgi:hypothetical protein
VTGKKPQSPGVVVRLHVAALVQLYARVVAPAAHATNLEDDAPGRHATLAQQTCGASTARVCHARFRS